MNGYNVEKGDFGYRRFSYNGHPVTELQVTMETSVIGALTAVNAFAATRPDISKREIDTLKQNIGKEIRTTRACVERGLAAIAKSLFEEDGS